MKRIAMLAMFALSGCEWVRYYTPPPVTAEMARSGHVDLATVQTGRLLFAHRCIQCHTLPSVWYYRAEDWPLIVNSMAQRANLKPAEREAVVAYILAVRRQR
jgi:hypothetical protein